MLKKAASGVLSSQESSTYPTEGTLQVLALPAALPAERRVLARRGWAGEISRLFEHPAEESVGSMKGIVRYCPRAVAETGVCTALLERVG
jgi:hypothetical protein